MMPSDQPTTAGDVGSTELGITVVDHYGGDQDRAAGTTLVQRITEALLAAGLTQAVIPVTALAPFDQFHVGGLQSTIDLAEMAQIKRGERVIDIGSGLGGPSRYLAATFDCQVLGIDLSPSFVAAANYLAGRAGLTDKVTYTCADAVHLPVSAVGFDLAWTQHVAMNIGDRAGLYRTVFAALRPGGRFAIYDVVAGEQAPVIYPVPWARTPASSFLLTPAAMRAVLEDTGFEVVHWRDRTADAVAWSAQQAAASQDAPAPRPPGLSVAMGGDFPQLAANLGRNLREGRTGIVQALLVRP
jgi:sarcosine/dimethylglycine N-methyltransferase